MWVNLTMLSKGSKTQKSTAYTLPWSSKSGNNNLCSSFGYIQGDFWGDKEDSEVLIMCWFLFWVPLTLVCSLCKNSSSCTFVITDVCVLYISINFLWKWGSQLIWITLAFHLPAWNTDVMHDVELWSNKHENKKHMLKIAG